MLPPEHIHPALWRATELARHTPPSIATGHAELSAQLPGGGWPVATLIELLLPHPGIGEIRLLRSALAQLDPQRRIALVQPPYTPHIASWMSWRLDPLQLLWIAPERPFDTLWAAEQILKNASCAALLCWLPQQASAQSLRRLHLAAQATDMLFFTLRPTRAAQQASPAPLRLMLTPAVQGLSVHILKRRGPPCDVPLAIRLDTETSSSTLARPYEPSLDRHRPARTAPGRRLPALV